MNAANLRRHQTIYRRWHCRQSQRHVLRVQLGFDLAQPSRPDACIGCIHYHGKAYGQSQAKRTLLICGFHPYGWQGTGGCPDWQGVSD